VLCWRATSPSSSCEVVELRVEWIVVTERGLSESDEAQREYESWLRRHALEDPPAEAVRIDVIRAAPTDRVRYRLSVAWLAGDAVEECGG